MISVNLIGICLIAFFMVFVIRKPHKRLSDYFLILTNVFLAAILFSDIWIKASLTLESFVFQTLVSFYLFPAFFLYALLLLDPEQRIKVNWLWVGSYAISITLFLIIDIFVWQTYEQIGIQALYEKPPLSYHFFYKTHKIFIVICLIWLLRKLSSYQDQIEDRFSFIEPISLGWLRNFSWVYMCINAIGLFGFLIYNIGWVEDIDAVFGIMNGTVVLSMFYLTYHGVRQYTLMEFVAQQEQKQGGNPQKEQDTTSSLPQTEKYQTSSLSQADMDDLYEKVLGLLEQDQIYLEPQLQIQDIADRLEVNTHKLSQTINSLAQKSFFDLINGYRVEHLKTLLLKPDNKQFTILALGLDSGFNSKASLNRIFKKFTGMSPREYQRSQLLK